MSEIVAVTSETYFHAYMNIEMLKSYIFKSAKMPQRLLVDGVPGAGKSKMSSVRIVTATTGGRDAYDKACRARTYISLLRNVSTLEGDLYMQYNHFCLTYVHLIGLALIWYKTSILQHNIGRPVKLCAQTSK